MLNIKMQLRHQWPNTSLSSVRTHTHLVFILSNEILSSGNTVSQYRRRPKRVQNYYLTERYCCIPVLLSNNIQATKVVMYLIIMKY